MFNKKLEEALNDQLNKELYSAYLYLGMAAHFESEGLKGFAGWMQMQAKEEQEHAMKIYEYLFSVDGAPVFKAIQEAPTHYEKKPVEIIQEVLKHEQFITASINHLYELSLTEKDYKTQMFLQWFITEQVEEEENARDILDKFKYIENNATLLFLDNELGKRQ